MKNKASSYTKLFRQTIDTTTLTFLRILIYVLSYRLLFGKILDKFGFPLTYAYICPILAPIRMLLIK